MSSFHVRLLGGFAVEDPSGEITRSLSQRRAEAVLAILAVAGALGCTRERLIGLLWPEKDEATARHNLRDALYAIRSALGRAAIPGTGQTLHLDPAVVTSDVRGFRQALETDRLADAVAVYRGPLLDGFHLEDALEFERWLERERSKLHRERQGAAKQLAQEAEASGRWEVAAEWWGRAVALDRYDSRLVARRIEALARAGDLANAVLEGEAHMQLLRSELDLEADPAFREALERIRRGELAPDPGPGATRGGASEEKAGPVPPNVPDPDGTPRMEPLTRPGEAGGGERGARRTGVAAAVTASAVLVVIIAALVVDRGRTGFRLVDPVQVTTATGVESSASWSPDGRTLAYASTQGGDSDIWVTQPGTEEAVNRTPDNAWEDTHPRWSPDGRWIAFFSERSGGGYFVMPALGGTPRRVASWPPDGPYPGPPAWSPDGEELAFARGQTGVPWIEIVTVGSGESRRVVLPTRPRSDVVADLSWSPNDRFLTYRRAISPFAATGELWLTVPSTGQSRQLTAGIHRDISPAWSTSSSELLFISDRAGSPDLWRLGIGPHGRARGSPVQLTAGMELTDIAVRPDGRQLAYTRGRRVLDVFRAPVPTDRPVTWADVEQLTFDEADFESVDVDDRGRLLLSSDRSGNWDIFLRPADGGSLQRLTTDPELDAGPAWKPDGTGLVFYSSRSGHRQIWLMSLEDRRPQQLTYGPTEKLYPEWSPDGLQIAAGGPGLIVVSVEDGTVRRLTDAGPGAHPAWSPDGRWIAFTRAGDDPLGLYLISADGGVPKRLTDVKGGMPRWSPDGRTLYFVGRAEHSDTIWALTLETGEVRPVTSLTGRPGHLGRLGLAVDDRNLYFTWRESRGDLWVADIVPSPDP